MCKLKGWGRKSLKSGALDLPLNVPNIIAMLWANCSSLIPPLKLFKGYNFQSIVRAFLVNMVVERSLLTF